MLFFVYMQYDEFHRRLRRAELSIKEFADFLGVNPKSISNYSQKGEVPNHLALIALMLAELIKYDVKPKDITAILNTLGRRPRKPGSEELLGGEKNESK